MTPPLQLRLRSLGLEPARGVSDHLSRVLAQPIDELQFSLLAETATHIGVTDEFVRICDYFKAEPGHTPAGFRFEYELEPDGLLNVNLKRDIGYDSDGRKRPTAVIYSADSANPTRSPRSLPCSATSPATPASSTTCSSTIPRRTSTTSSALVMR